MTQEVKMKALFYNISHEQCRNTKNLVIPESEPHNMKEMRTLLGDKTDNFM